jgi:hypothetical protein
MIDGKVGKKEMEIKERNANRDYLVIPISTRN